MTDRLTQAQRSELMSAVRGRDTGPEKAIRSLLHRMGFRFRLHAAELPGKPDIVLPRHRKAIFVHGCFWHGHKKCIRSERPKSNVDFWNAKLDGNISRDLVVRKRLQSLGWRVLVIWECQIGDADRLKLRLEKFVSGGGRISVERPRPHQKLP